MLLSVPVVSAEIVFVNNLGKYNIGDDINVQGYVQPSQDSIGFFSLELKCGDSSTKITKQLIHILMLLLTA